ncbi:MAG TPA: hypothetical protein VFM96_09180 [Gaiellaceae bacterium]|nr:hypothetical protein [Gaiellaceae bacterium]
MKRSLIILAAGIAVIAVVAPAGAGNNVSITIRHQTVGCHAWAIGSGKYAAFQTLTVARGTTLTFTNNDVMPHTLAQLAGPVVALQTPRMAKMHARATIAFTKPGSYVFGTKPGEDYMSGVKTTGPDNVLKLVMIVK